MVTQTNTNANDLLFLCVHCEQRPLVSQTKNVFMSPRPICHLITLNFFFTENLRWRLYSMRTSRKTDFRKLKITLVAWAYPGQRPQWSSLPPRVLLEHDLMLVLKSLIFVLNLILRDFQMG